CLAYSSSLKRSTFMALSGILTSAPLTFNTSAHVAFDDSRSLAAAASSDMPQPAAHKRVRASISTRTGSPRWLDGRPRPSALYQGARTKSLSRGACIPEEEALDWDGTLGIPHLRGPLSRAGPQNRFIVKGWIWSKSTYLSSRGELSRPTP